MSSEHPTALIADDEPLLRDELAALLAEAWPELEVVARARNGREAIELFEEKRPDVCFLDVQMPGVSGVEAAARIGTRAHLVFVTAFDQYALKAFEHGVLDYLVKPVEPARLASTVARLRDRLRGTLPAQATEDLLRHIAAHFRKDGPAPLQWIRASVGQSLRLIAVEDIDYLRSDEKYTLVAWRDESGQPAEALIGTPLKSLLPQLDAKQFVQVHRSVVVNLRSIARVARGLHDTAEIHLKGRGEVLPVSRSFLHLFKQM